MGRNYTLGRQKSAFIPAKMKSCELQFLHNNTVWILALCVVLVLLIFFLGARSGQKYCSMEMSNAAEVSRKGEGETDTLTEQWHAAKS